MSGIAHAKLLLFGEHAAIYGYPAIGIPLPWQIRVALSPCSAPGRNSQPNLFRVIPELEAFPAFRTEIQTDIPIGVGFGSSGALCAATVKSAYDYMRQSADLDHYWKLSHELEKQYHRTPSGIDTGISLRKSLCYFEKLSGELPACTQLPTPALSLVVGALPRKSNTADLIEQVARQSGRENILATLGDLTREVSKNLRDSAFLGACADEAQRYLAQLDLTTPELDVLLQEGKRLGALGGKVSGAGGGGAFYFIARDPENGAEIAKGLNCFIQEKQIPCVLKPQLLQFAPSEIF